jgi:purine-binding chemotaxis protein CheW
VSLHVCVTLGLERYGVDVAHVSEVAELGTITPVPGAGRHMVGVRHLRGEILPVAHLHDLLGASAGSRRQIVVVRDGDRCAGLAVDRAYAIEDLPEADGPWELLTRGSVMHEHAVVGLLDIPAILDAISLVT